MIVHDIGEASPDPSPSTRDRLLQAVIELAGNDGERMVTLRSVAAKSGVTHGLVRHYFGTREAMLDEAFKVAAQQDISDSNIAASSVNAFADGLVAMLEADSARQLMQFDLVLAEVRHPSEAATARCLYQRYYDLIASTLAEVGIPDPDGDWAALFFAMIDGISLQHFLFRDTRRTEEMLAKVRELLNLIKSGV